MALLIKFSKFYLARPIFLLDRVFAYHWSLFHCKGEIFGSFSFSFSTPDFFTKENTEASAVEINPRRTKIISLRLKTLNRKEERENANGKRSKTNLK